MEIIKNIKVPTGNIIIGRGEKGLIEFLSIGDYGKEKNLKADFLNLKEDINGVPNGDIMPLQEKWVVTVSSQYGCSMGCKFCDVPKVGKGKNASLNDISNQVIEALKLHPEVKGTKRLNIHYARMGEPTWNFEIISHAKKVRKEIFSYIGRSMVHPVVSTMMPKNNIFLMKFLQDWCEVKNYNYRGDAGLQISLNSTCNKERDYMFSGNSECIENISKLLSGLPNPIGRKYTLNFALSDYTIDAEYLSKLFPPSRFLCKITPMHETKSCLESKTLTENGYVSYKPYKKVEDDLKGNGFDVIVFVPSLDEDKSRITCGNAILSNLYLHSQ